jgi:hypothetical protein
MSAIDIDVIGPKNSPYVTIQGANIIPNTTNLSFQVSGASANLTITGSAYAFGKITVVQFHKLENFTGTSPPLTFTIAGIPLPAQTVYFPCLVTQTGTAQIGYISITSGGAATIAAAAAGTGFTSGQQASVWELTVFYASA